MLINKKYSLILLCMLVSSVLFAQSATADLTKRYLERANTQYENAEYDAAYKTINAVLRLNETTGMPANVTLMATQIYSKVLDNILSTGNYDEFTTITSNIESYPSIVDGTLRKKINEVYAKQIIELERQIDNQKLAGAFMAGGNNTESKKKIDKLIKEIDRCISLMEG